MKFGKEFKSQMVPEWQEAYMNYNYLKTTLKDISFSKKPQTSDVSLKRNGSLYRAFSGLTRRHSNNFKIEDEENHVIQVNEVLRFYKGNEKKVLSEAEELEKQMDVLIALRIKVEKPDGVSVGASQMGE
ncbi:hypothetical protein GIB67_007315 [Kingdonia uniflora]|uniref:SPX domain-containing protein n=1 Tax=Kingdonia uniflora TaxID=39325 RepID=A0A7J7NXX6_9MAGN|nr:hypothetical protein GIB67_007315 [Kingdonia uniflora]